MHTPNIYATQNQAATSKRIDFAEVKSQFFLPEVISAALGTSYKSCGGIDRYQLDPDECPFCGHKGCFKLHCEESENEHYFCYSCGVRGDIFNFLVHFDQAKHSRDAAIKLINGELDGVTILPAPRANRTKVEAERIELTAEQFARRQALYLAAWEYYFEQMIDGESTPLQSLMDKRKLSQNVLIDYEVGYSRGALWRYLIDSEFTLEEMYASGLVKESPQSPYDFFPKGVYIFPHYDETGAICRFTFKDPEKKVAYQLSKLFWLNNIQFYGQHTMNRQGTVAVVEGEFDLLALMDHGWQGPVIATNGQISQAQLAWIKENLHDRNVVTFFDSDPAGDKYREKLVQLGLPALVQVTLPEGQGKDIDDYLRQDNALSIEVLVEQYGVVAAQASIETTSEPMQDESLASHQQTDESEQLNSSYYDAFDEDTLNDVGNADRLAEVADGKLVYVPELNCLYMFDEQCWRPIGDKELALARCIGEGIIAQANRMLEDPATLKDKTKRQQADKLLAFGRQSLNRKKLADMLEIFKSSNLISAKAFDADKMLMGINNGVLDLATGKLLAANKEMYISRYSDINYKPDVTCPRWLQFIDEITCGDVEYAKFLQRMVGYILTGRTDEQVLFFLYGHGCNGKSTFMNIIQRLMGSYYHQISSDVLLQSNNSGKGPNPSLAKLNGSRLVVANELPEGSRMDENLVKSMTGSDVIVARQLYAKVELEYIPMFKLIMVGNHKPVIRDTSLGMWRRMILLPFNASFSQQQMDPQLMDKLYAELSGILNWALEGVQMWLKDGIKASIPNSIKSGIAEYRHESDLLAMFLEECTNKGDFVYTDELYDAFRKWAERDGDWKMTRNIMTKRLVEKGFEKGRHNSKAMIKGIKLKSAFDDIPEQIPQASMGMRHATPTNPNSEYSV
ncbi:phage / plasmid primase, P4 family [Shewanella sp. W3-18-1]|uniref:phage/plasmid primase, P4 family n=1 Tax=Shewanella sp. (strain W3-18-1) TaxID=351745 RepID=UPI0000ECFB2D|nr:phage/plasmid primase, P4 family [Shewanella sp. W3-18-1]ABM25032.1 phage / plasmid primase, P4 family [Shewanella sp. W3-18-1]